jgi:hypothetical protein
VDIKMG